MGVRKVRFKVVWGALERRGKTCWAKIGLAWENRKGGMFARLDALPLSGRICIRDDVGAETELVTLPRGGESQ